MNSPSLKSITGERHREEGDNHMSRETISNIKTYKPFVPDDACQVDGRQPTRPSRMQRARGSAHPRRSTHRLPAVCCSRPRRRQPKRHDNIYNNIYIHAQHFYTRQYLYYVSRRSDKRLTPEDPHTTRGRTNGWQYKYSIFIFNNFFGRKSER